MLGVFTFFENCFYILSMPPFGVGQKGARKLCHPENKTPAEAKKDILRCLFLSPLAPVPRVRSGRVVL